MEKIIINDGWLIYDPHFYSASESELVFEGLKQLPTWEQGTIKIFGKDHKTPRLESFHADKGLRYGYSGQRMRTHEFNDTLQSIRTKLCQESGFQFNSVLCNLYRNGSDSNGWHADNEHELGKDPIIASISFGATRRFDLKHALSGEKFSLELSHGSLLIMGGAIQHHWKHQIAKTKKVMHPRINLTFRLITHRSVD
ncbi:MAG: alpha-ketoglutarate-dependent dioxygenase AlkB family protein [Flavobacteriia bacterium]|jgi:alkylated DNA repair dioxygenase AlkB